MPEIVYMIAEEKFGGDLSKLAREFHVWVLLTDHNAELYRLACESGELEYTQQQGLSGFHWMGSVLESVYHYLGTIDEHHGDPASDPPWEELRIVGVSAQQLDETVVERELAVGKVSIADAEGCAVVRRAVQQAASADCAPRGR